MPMANKWLWPLHTSNHGQDEFLLFNQIPQKQSLLVNAFDGNSSFVKKRRPCEVYWMLTWISCFKSFTWLLPKPLNFCCFSLTITVDVSFELLSFTVCRTAIRTCNTNALTDRCITHFLISMCFRKFRRIRIIIWSQCHMVLSVVQGSIGAELLTEYCHLYTEICFQLAFSVL